MDEHSARQKALFGSSTWIDFNTQLDEITAVLKTVPAAVDAQLARDQATRRRTLSDQSKRATQIAIQRDEIVQNRIALQNELKGEREKAAGQRTAMNVLADRIAQLQRQIAVKAAEIDAEVGGLGSSRRKGRGPAYRKLATEAASLESALLRSNAELKVLKSQRGSLTTAIADLKTRIAERINAEQQLISQAEGATAEIAPNAKASQLTERKARALSQLAGLRDARRLFETKPSASTLGTLGTHCIGSLDFITSNAGQSGLKRAPTCNVNELRVASAALFALTDGIRKLATDCQVQQSRDSKGFEAEVNLARDCIVKSGLLPTQTASITAQLDRLERERDDKAHRFVVSMNAFLDGDKLAFLAAGIALAIDLLVLVSGLLGALALRPRALDIAIPNEKYRTDLGGEHQNNLPRVLRLALGNGIPEENAKRILQYIEPAEIGAGIGMKVEIAKVTAADRAIVRQFLNAGTAFGQVYSTATPDAAVAIDRDLYFAAVELADQATTSRGNRHETRTQSAAPSSLRDRLTSPKTVFTSAGREENSSPNEAKTAPAVPSAYPTQASASSEADLRPQLPREPSAPDQSAPGQTPAKGPDTPRHDPPAQPQAAPQSNDEPEDQLVSVADGSFKFDLSRR